MKSNAFLLYVKKKNNYIDDKKKHERAREREKEKGEKWNISIFWTFNWEQIIRCLVPLVLELSSGKGDHSD